MGDKQRFRPTWDFYALISITIISITIFFWLLLSFRNGNAPLFIFDTRDKGLGDTHANGGRL